MSFNRTLKTTTALAVALTATLAQSAGAAQCVWNGGIGLYATPLMWSCGMVPGAGDTVLIDNGKTGVTSIVALAGTTGYAGTLTLDAGDQLTLNGSYFRVAGGSATINGTVSVANASRFTTNNGAAVSLDGSGTITLDNSVNFAQFGGDNAVYTIGGALTVAGAGDVGFGDARIANAGTIAANVNGGTLTINPTGGGGALGGGLGPSGDAGIYNTGVMQASNGGTLVLADGRYDNTGGTIRALTNGTVSFGNDVYLRGGTLTGPGTIQGSGNVQTFSGVTLATGSTLALNNDYVYVDGTLTDNGTITLANNGRIRTDNGTGTLSGTGVVTLDNSQNAAILGDNGGLFTIGSGITVNGSGTIANGDSSIVSNALISANVSGGTITVNPFSGSGGTGSGLGTDGISTFVNNSTMQATNGGTLLIADGRYDNTSGVIQSLTNGTVSFGNDVYLRGGTLTGPGTIQGLGNVQTFAGVTLTTGSTLTLNNDYVYVDGTLTDNGTITLANNSRIRTDNGTGTLSGLGTVTLDGSSILGDNGGTFTIGSGITVNGGGTVANGDSDIVSNALISATTGTMTINPYSGSGGSNSGLGVDKISGFVNNNVMQAAAGATLLLADGRYDNTNGVIQSLANGTVSFGNDVYLRGGTLTGPGTIQGSGNVQTFAGVTLATGSTLAAEQRLCLRRRHADRQRHDHAGEQQPDPDRQRDGHAVGHRHRDARRQLDPGRQRRHVHDRLGDHGQRRRHGRQRRQHHRQQRADLRDGRHDDAQPVRRRRRLQLGLGVDGISDFINNKVVQAANGGTLFLSDGRYDNTGGVIRSLTGGTVSFGNDVYLRGGTLTGRGRSGERPDADLRGGDADERLDAGDQQRLCLCRRHAGRQRRDHAREQRPIRTDNGTGALSGTGMLTLDGSSILGDNGGTFTIGSGITVNGGGTIANGDSDIVNNGLISATAGTMTINPFGGGGGSSSGLGTGGMTEFLNTAPSRAAAPASPRSPTGATRTPRPARSRRPAAARW